MRNALVLLPSVFFAACSSLPPTNLRLSIQTEDGKVDVSALADDEVLGSTKNKPEAVATCVKRRFQELEKLGFADYVAAFRRRPALEKVAPRISGCAFDGFDTEDSDRQLLPFTLHESTHLLGSVFDGVCPKAAKSCDWNSMRYEIYASSAPNRQLVIPYAAGMPAIGTITKELGADSMHDNLRMYLGLASRDAEANKPVDAVTTALGRGDFYLLWDEWNAYLTSLEIYTAQAAQANCWVYMTFDSYETALSWPDLIHRYLEVLKTNKAAAYRKLTADGRFGKALTHQLDRSETAISAAAKHECVRRPLPEVVAAERTYVAVYGKLRARAKNP